MMLEHVKRASSLGHERVLAAIGAEAREWLSRSMPMDWVPIDVDVTVIEAAERELGRERLLELVTMRQREQFDTSLFRRLTAELMRLSRFSPALLLKMAEPGWRHLFRKCGLMKVEGATDNSVVVSVRELPGSCTRSEAWIACIPAGIGTIFDHLGLGHERESVVIEADSRAPAWRYRWRSP